MGGPGSSGVIIFHKKLYQNKIPDHPGGGTVLWTNPWGGHHYYDDVEIREDGGTPGFLQAIKASLAVLLKEEMGVKQMAEREHELKERLLNGLAAIPDIVVLEAHQHKRLGYISLYQRDIHHNLMVRLLNDRYGIQTRGGCSCAGTYGHVLLNIDFHESKRITDMISIGDLSRKPGWVRVSLHPTMKDNEVDYIINAISEIERNYKDWSKNYTFDSHLGDYIPVDGSGFRINLDSSFKSK